MDTKALEYILEIARCRSVTRAARSLGISQSALSQILLRVEREIGTPLFVRQKRVPKLTEAGELYVEAAESIIDAKNRFLAELHDLTAEHRIRVGVTSHWGMDMMLEILPEFHERFPDAPIELIQRNYSSLNEEFRQYRIDIAVTTFDIRNPLPQHGELLRDEEMKLCVNKSHPFSIAHAGDSEIPEHLLRPELRDTSFIRSASGSTFRATEDALLERIGFLPRTFCEVTDYITFINLVDDNRGFAFISSDYEDLSRNSRFWSLSPRLFRKNALLIRPGLDLGEEERYFINRIKNYVFNIGGK